MAQLISAQNRKQAQEKIKIREQQIREQQKKVQQLSHTGLLRSLSRTGAMKRQQSLKEMGVEIKRLRERKEFLMGLTRLQTPLEFQRDERLKIKGIVEDAQEAISRGIPTRLLSGEVFQIVRRFRLMNEGQPTAQQIERQVSKDFGTTKLVNISSFSNSNVSQSQLKNVNLSSLSSQQKIFINKTKSPKPFSKRIKSVIFGN